MAKRVYLETRDLMFRSKLRSLMAEAGAEVSRDDTACELAVVELSDSTALDRIAALVRRGLPVLAFGSHVQPDVLRGAREAGATAVPNSQVEEQLRELLKP